MGRVVLRACLTLALLGAWSASAAAAPVPAQVPAPQTGAPARDAATGRLRVFLDCDSCFSTFLREEIEWVDFVRQPQDADLQVLASSNQTGGGGREVALRFIGRGRFEGADSEFRVVSAAGDTEDMRRRAILRTVTIALLAYLERAGLSGDVTLAVETVRRGQTQTSVADDPWNAWVFSLRASGSGDLQESSREWNWEGRASADRVTEQWKISFGARTEARRERFTLDEEDERPLTVSRHENSVSGLAVKSFGPHWSAGVEAAAESSTFSNRRFNAVLAPAVEYSIFPYEQYASRQLRFKYLFGVEHSKYREVTLYDKLSETNPGHEISGVFEQVQPWGEVQMSVELSQYLHDLAKYRFEVGGELSWRVARNLSVTFDGSASRVRDQLSLPRRDATPEEVLLRLRELRSGYQVDFSLGVTYRFGSIFNNIVNPRFGR